MNLMQVFVLMISFVGSFLIALQIEDLKVLDKHETLKSILQILTLSAGSFFVYSTLMLEIR